MTKKEIKEILESELDGVFHYVFLNGKFGYSDIGDSTGSSESDYVMNNILGELNEDDDEDEYFERVEEKIEELFNKFIHIYIDSSESKFIILEFGSDFSESDLNSLIKYYSSNYSSCELFVYRGDEITKIK